MVVNVEGGREERKKGNILRGFVLERITITSNLNIRYF
jgi:hypothetical protein